VYPIKIIPSKINHHNLIWNGSKENTVNLTESKLKQKLSEVKVSSLSICSNFSSSFNGKNANLYHLSEIKQHSQKSVPLTNKIQLKRYKVKILQKVDLERPFTAATANINIVYSLIRSKNPSLCNSEHKLKICSEIGLSPINIKEDKPHILPITINNNLIKKRLRHKKAIKINQIILGKSCKVKNLEEMNRKNEDHDFPELNKMFGNSKILCSEKNVNHNVIQRKFDKGIGLVDQALQFKEECRWNEALKCIRSGLDNLEEAAYPPNQELNQFKKKDNGLNSSKQAENMNLENESNEDTIKTQEVFHNRKSKRETLQFPDSIYSSTHKILNQESKENILSDFINIPFHRDSRTSDIMHRCNSKKDYAKPCIMDIKLGMNDLNMNNQRKMAIPICRKDWGTSILFKKAKNEDFEFNSERYLDVYSEYEIEFIISLIVKKEKEIKNKDNLKIFYSKSRATVQKLCNELQLDDLYQILSTENLQVILILG